ncbi:unnamed protein product [Discula destructiva]
MDYDYTGSWDAMTGHQANLYPNPSNPLATKLSTDAAVSDFIAAGVPASQIILGMPTYGRSFENTMGLGKAFTGVGNGTWDAGVWDYKALPRAGAQVYMDDVAGASYTYDATSQELISYETADMVTRKVSYLLDKGLGGCMFWEASGDRHDSQSLILASYNALGGAACLQSTQNLLSYPASQYSNIGSGMG